MRVDEKRSWPKESRPGWNVRIFFRLVPCPFPRIFFRNVVTCKTGAYCRAKTTKFWNFAQLDDGALNGNVTKMLRLFYYAGWLRDNNGFVQRRPRNAEFCVLIISNKWNRNSTRITQNLFILQERRITEGDNILGFFSLNVQLLNSCNSGDDDDVNGEDSHEGERLYSIVCKPLKRFNLWPWKIRYLADSP